MAELPDRFRLVRATDLLVVDVELVNLAVTADGARLARVEPDQPARLILRLPAQHVAEEAFFETQGGAAPAGPPPVKALAAGESRLVFTLPADRADLPLSVGGILGWDELEPALAGNALPPEAVDGPRPAVPSPQETAVEFPYRLLLSPDSNGRWTHRVDPFTNADRTELWHTRLHGAGPTVPVRAVGRRPVPDSLRSSLSDPDLDEIVILSADFGIRPKSARAAGIDPRLWALIVWQAGLAGFHYKPVPLQAEQLMLTALGASARLRGAWNYPGGSQNADTLKRFGMPAPSLEQYEHIAGLGRDQFVRVVRRGFLSTGHRASLVKVTERRFEPKQLRTEAQFGVFGGTAYLRQYFQVVVQEPHLDYRLLKDGYPFDGREMPLRSLTLTTLSTPKIDFPNKSQAIIEKEVRDSWIPQSPKRSEDELLLQQAIQRAIEAALKVPFWIRVAQQDFEFGLTGPDWDGAPASFTAPLMFIPYEVVNDDPGPVLREFALGPESRRTRPLANQAVALADPTDSAPGSTRSPVESLTLALCAVPPAKIGKLPRTYRPRWLPAMAAANVHVDSIERVTGSSAAVRILLSPTYLGGAANAAGVYAELADGPLVVRFPAERGGGLARPDAPVRLLSSRQGAIAPAFANPSVSTADLGAIFGDAKLFGTVPLRMLLAPLDALGAGDFALSDLPEPELQAILDQPGRELRVPVLRTRVLRDGGGRPTAVEARYVWKPAIRSETVAGFTFDFVDNRSALVLDAHTVTPLDGGEARAEMRGELRDFTMTFAGVIGIHMDRLAFASLPGRKPDITAEGFDLTFLGPLEFVNTLKEILPADGFSDPPAVSVSPAGISAGYTLGIPSFGVGIFTLENLSLSATLAIPFNDQPASFRFAVSERHHPFIVTVSLFGGGGFFAIGVSAKGVESVEAAIEFGAAISLNLGVASGGVSVMAGIYFGMTGSVTTLTGYLRVNGYLSVLGLISISVEFYLAFTYRLKENGNSEVWGQARVTVSVKLACFSKSVSLSIERRFAGASGDPTFDQLVEPDDWERYCLAFAA